MSLPEEELCCPICIDLPCDAVETTCCHQLFCKSCLQAAQSSSCPHCRHDPFDYNDSVFIRRLIDRIRVHCDYCGNEIIRSCLLSHMKVCTMNPSNLINIEQKSKTIENLNANSSHSIEANKGTSAVGTKINQNNQNDYDFSSLWELFNQILTLCMFFKFIQIHFSINCNFNFHSFLSEFCQFHIS